MPTTCPVCFRPIPAGAAYCNGDSCGEAAPRDLAEKPRQAPRVVNVTSAASPPLDWLPSAPPPPSPVIDWLPPVPPAPPPPPTVVESVSSAPLRTAEATPLPTPPPPEPRGEQSRSRIPWCVLLAAAPVAALMLTAVIILASNSEEETPPARPRPQPEAKAPRSTEPPAVVALDPGSKATLAEIPPPKPPTKPAAQPRPVAPQPASLPTPQLGEPELLVPAFSRPEVEVVFCLDTTGSMGGLLDGAKKKIWSICNQIAGGRPVPEPRVGLVAYRDRGDAYVTKVFNLTRDLDAVHANLEGLSAGGGGDTPESVNQALDDAVNKIKWSTDKHTLRIIFLVGDAPPHMDYADDVKYQETCDRAKKRGIIINTIQCGNDARCRSTWQEIGLLAGGEYAAIPQAGGARFVSTPFDDRLGAINKELLGTVLLYGLPARRRGEERLLAAARAMRGAAAADRAAFMGKSGKVAAYDLLDAIKERRVKLETIAIELLPAELRKRKTLAERRAFLDDLAKRRVKLFKEAVELDRKRAAFTARELGAGGKDSFDSQVLKMLRKQAAKFEIAY